MNKYKFNITIETNEVLNNEQKNEILDEFRKRLWELPAKPLECLKGVNIVVAREVTLEDIGEAFNI